jgi:hypothetical protein
VDRVVESLQDILEAGPPVGVVRPAVGDELPQLGEDGVRDVGPELFERDLRARNK